MTGVKVYSDATQTSSEGGTRNKQCLETTTFQTIKGNLESNVRELKLFTTTHCIPLGDEEIIGYESLILGHA